MLPVSSFRSQWFPNTDDRGLSATTRPSRQPVPYSRIECQQLPATRYGRRECTQPSSPCCTPAPRVCGFLPLGAAVPCAPMLYTRSECLWLPASRCGRPVRAQPPSPCCTPDQSVCGFMPLGATTPCASSPPFMSYARSECLWLPAIRCGSSACARSACP